MKLNGHRLNLVRHQQFVIDRTNWCEYAAFNYMYDLIELELIEAKAMTMLEEPECQDKDGNRVEFNHRHMALK